MTKSFWILVKNRENEEGQNCLKELETSPAELITGPPKKKLKKLVKENGNQWSVIPKFISVLVNFPEN